MCIILCCPLLFYHIGTGRTGFIPVGPNNYPFYSSDEVYKPVLQSDGGQLSGEQHEVCLTSHCGQPAQCRC